MKDAIVRAARTALLSGSLGVLLYLAFAWMAQMPELMVSLLGTVGSGALVALILQEMAYALRTGVIARLPIAIRQTEEPTWFWGTLAFSGLCLLLLVPLQAWCAWRLFHLLAIGG